MRTAAGRPPVSGGTNRLISSALTTRAPAASRARLSGRVGRVGWLGCGLRRSQETSSTSRRTSFWATSGSTGPSPNEGQSRAHPARAAGGLAGVADPAAVKDQPVAHDRPLLARDQRGQVGLDLDRILLLGQLHAPRQPAHVGVHGDARDAERMAEDDVGRLAPDARQLDQIVELAGHLTAVTLRERGPQTDQRLGLGAEESEGPQKVLQLGPFGPRVGGRIGVAGEQPWGVLVDPLVGGLSRKNGRYQQFQWRCEVQRAPRVGVQAPRAPARSGGRGGCGPAATRRGPSQQQRTGLKGSGLSLRLG